MFASKSLSKSERHYGASKRELLAVIFALHKFAYYLRGNKFNLFTDNNALTFMLTQKKTLPMLLNWLDYLLEFDF